MPLGVPAVQLAPERRPVDHWNPNLEANPGENQMAVGPK